MYLHSIGGSMQSFHFISRSYERYVLVYFQLTYSFLKYHLRTVFVKVRMVVIWRLTADAFFCFTLFIMSFFSTVSTNFFQGRAPGFAVAENHTSHRNRILHRTRIPRAHRKFHVFYFEFLWWLSRSKCKYM
jgi:hypothetical protein